MKNTNRLFFALLAAAALVFAAGCSDGSEDVDVDIEQGAVDTGVSDTDNSSSASYNSDSKYYGTYKYTVSYDLAGTTYTYTYYFKFTSSSWSYSANGVGVSGSTWKYSNGHIYCYIDETQYYDITVKSTSKLEFQGITYTKS